MLLSDRDIRSETAAGHSRLDPWQPEMVQPSSVDVRLDRYFRLFDNHKYPFIDPATDQPELTRLIEVAPDEAFVLHPASWAVDDALREPLAGGRWLVGADALHAQLVAWQQAAGLRP